MPDGRRTPEERVDAAIDLAVRDMMDVEPRADLRARVIEQIERPRRAVKWTWLLAPLAAAALLVVAVLLRQPQPRPERPPSPDIVLHAPETRLPVRIARGEQPRHLTGIRPGRPHERRITATVATADDTNFSTEPPAGFAVVDPLAPPPPIVVEHIPPAAAPAVASLDIAPLQLPALEMNALPESPRERREE